jgi:hypothetical protein
VKAAERYDLKRLQAEVASFEEAVETERAEAPEKSRLQHDWEGQADVLELDEQIDKALKDLSKLPSLPARTEGRNRLVAQGEALKSAAANYELQRLRATVPGYLDAVRQEVSESQKAADLLREEEREAKRIVQVCAELAANIDHSFFIMIKETALLDEEGRALMEWRGKKVAALKGSNLEALKTVHDEIAKAFDTWWTDRPTLKKRFSRQRADKTRGKAAAMMCVRAGMTVESFEDIHDRTAFRNFTGTPVTKYGIRGIDECRTHAWRRHTPEGVWKLQAIETAHVSDVALFRNAGELDAALNAVASKTDAENWNSRPKGGLQCKIGNAIAYGTVVGADEIYLETCFPLGVNIPKDQVREALREADFDDFLHKLGL